MEEGPDLTDAVERAMELGHDIAWSPVVDEFEMLHAWVCGNCGGAMIEGLAGTTDGLSDPCPKPTCLHYWQSHQDSHICDLPRGHDGEHRMTGRRRRR
ncbi:hypothetical protein [Phytoactinopolyspora halotolerans]|uniref:Uncharacterized protein n=1 Tax=Phytoactinopolyspora halotolerans TaxID=1981512 RepID=A0A6L9S1L7_9ACTN|nr:hypothetical protein [Phytoactinopolyspora halotolerans]NED98710.1 hypothetical protein [Phytoactinopolyspora halotolerans]